MKIAKNPFDGRSITTEFMFLIDDMICAKEWFSYEDIMDEHHRRYPKKYEGISDEDYSKKSVSNRPYHDDLKKAMLNVKKIITLEENGNNRNKRFRYAGDDSDPLKDFKENEAISNINTYVQFCLDSVGFLPMDWLESFFDGTLDMLKFKERKSKGKQFIMSSVDMKLTGLYRLPEIYEAIRDKKVLDIDYMPYGKDAEHHVFHPHLLREYNGRWFLFGFKDDTGRRQHHNLALDRITGISEHHGPGIKYKPAPKNYYEDFFSTRVGVSNSIDGMKARKIIFRAHKPSMFNLVKTKPFHESQTVVREYGEGGAPYGEFSITVELTNEFIGRILQMGADLEVTAPESVREVFRRRAKDIYNLYRNQS